LDNGPQYCITLWHLLYCVARSRGGLLLLPCFGTGWAYAVTGTNRPTTLLQSQAALLNREHSFYCSYSFGTATLRLNSCDSLPPCRPAGAINCLWTTCLGYYHNCSTYWPTDLKSLICDHEFKYFFIDHFYRHDLNVILNQNIGCLILNQIFFWQHWPMHVMWAGFFLPLRVNSLPLATIYEVKIPLRKWKKSLLFTMKYVPLKVWHQFLLFCCHSHNGELCDKSN
jgi:hypothetical protein